MASVLDVAKYIIENLGETTTMKLQKLVYYSQAWSLAWDGVPLFNEDFEAWANGPVCRELYNEHRGVFTVDSTSFLAGRNITNLFTDAEQETMDIVLRDYGSKEARWLSELTHKERPWRETRGNTPLGERSNAIIPKELMQEYYTGLLADG